MNETLMRRPAVVAAVGYKKSQLYALIKAGKFPAPLKLAGGGAVAWRSSDVQAWIAAQGQKQPAEAAQ